MILFRCTIIKISLFFFCLTSAAQNGRIIDSIESKFTSRLSSFQQTQLYLHIDKSVYVNNENVWFKAYILNSPVELEQQHTLHIFLSDRLKSKVVVSEKFVVEDGLAAGALFIPDSLPEGDYNLVAYTNTLPGEKDPFVFQQLISIRKSQEKEEAYTFRFENTKFSSLSDTIAFMCRIINSKSMYAKDADVIYKILANDKIITTGRNKINQYGELPVSFLAEGETYKFELETLIIKDKDSFVTRQPLSFLDNRINLRWYPEGGDLIDNIETKIVVEAIALTGKPAVIKAHLLEDGIPVASITTNVTGLALISIRPSATKKYNLQLEEASSQTVEMNFPDVKKNGYTISIENEMSGDTTFAVINKNGTGNTIHLLTHNYEQVFSFTDIMMKGNRALVKIPNAEMKSGLITLTVLDSIGRPCAERTIFNGYNQLPVMTIEADSIQYNKRSKINLKIIVKDSKGNPLTGVYSLSCVLKKRIDSTSYQDIMPYHFFNNYIQHNLIQKSSLFGMFDKETMKLFLLSRCWTKYKDPFVDSTVEIFAKNRNLDVSGYVLYRDKKLKKPVKLILLSNNNFEEIMTDEQGLFTIPATLLALQPDQYANLVVSAKNQIEYQVTFYDGVNALEKQIASRTYPVAYLIKAILPEEEKVALNKIKTLTAVVIKSQSTNDNWQSYRSKTCNDYVCMYNILNCRNHPFGTKPVDGGLYTYLGKLVRYEACEGDKRNVLSKIKGRYYSKEFYKADYEKFNPPDPEIYSTVYWTPQIITDKSGEAFVSFYTNDMAGIFSLIVEGVTEKGVINGKKLIKIIP